MAVRYRFYGEPAYGGEAASYGGSISGLPQETLERLRRELPQFSPIQMHKDGTVSFQSPFQGEATMLLVQAIDAITRANGKPVPELEALRAAATEEISQPATGIARLIRPELRALLSRAL